MIESVEQRGQVNTHIFLIGVFLISSLHVSLWEGIRIKWFFFTLFSFSSTFFVIVAIESTFEFSFARIKSHKMNKIVITNTSNLSGKKLKNVFSIVFVNLLPNRWQYYIKSWNNENQIYRFKRAEILIISKILRTDVQYVTSMFWNKNKAVVLYNSLVYVIIFIWRK